MRKYLCIGEAIQLIVYIYINMTVYLALKVYVCIFVIVCVPKAVTQLGRYFCCLLMDICLVCYTMCLCLHSTNDPPSPSLLLSLMPVTVMRSH